MSSEDNYGIPATIPEGEDADKWGMDEYGAYRIDDRAWSMNEIRDHPLFMEDVPSDISDNPHLLALQSILYDGNTPEQMAEHFKNLGNEAFRSSTNKVSSQNALMAYTKGLEMDCKDNVLNAVLHSNRAAVSMRIKQNDKAVDDCRRAIKLDPKNMKAYYRGAKSSEALGLTEQALKFCKGALQLKADDAELKQMLAKYEKQFKKEQEEHELRRKVEASEAQKFEASAASVRSVLAERSSTLGPVLFDVAMYFQGRLPEPKLVTVEADEAPAIEWPLLLLYDETSQSDFVETFDERCTLNDQFELMFPKDRRVDWDEEGKYTWDRLVCYLEHYRSESGTATELRRIDPGQPLYAGLENMRVPQCLTLHVLVNKTGAHESFCREHHLPMP
mmetsp:Transcript_19887/g.42489  ORF Transcript_19887/g.42489 Transcript_19887/m.42489 type:complete len:389 (-) Transcript_19887:189-1355(-)